MHTQSYAYYPAVDQNVQDLTCFVEKTTTPSGDQVFSARARRCNVCARMDEYKVTLLKKQAYLSAQRFHNPRPVY